MPVAQFSELQAALLDPKTGFGALAIAQGGVPQPALVVVSC